MLYSINKIGESLNPQEQTKGVKIKNMTDILNKKLFKYSGRIVKKDNAAYLGYTNSKVEFYARATKDTAVITARIDTKNNGEENEARLTVYLDDRQQEETLLVLHEESVFYRLVQLPDKAVHKITLIKITEAAMSYAKLVSIHIEGGELLPLPIDEDNRLKVEFIGDSITCGYGVYGEPESEYHIREEDGLKTYAAYAAKELNLNARYTAVSGFGVYTKYDGDREGILPKVYPYTNYFVDEEEVYDFKEFIPDVFVINLGTNDSGHLHNPEVQEGFVKNYTAFLEYLKSYAPDSAVLCICGTLCTNAFSFIETAVSLARENGLKKLYTYELPFHNVELDGMASWHPSLLTQQKDGKRLADKLREILDL